MSQLQDNDFTQLALDIKALGKTLGFQQLGISDLDLQAADQHFRDWIAKGWHGSMSYLERNQDKRANPALLVPGTIRIISVRMDYLPANTKMKENLKNKQQAYISRYALGRDYHKLIRKRLNNLAKKIMELIGPFGYRAFTDSAPILEKPIAAKAGLGWMGKHTLIMNREAGSWFFLGELFTDLPLPVDKPITEHCGSCTACLEVCPTQAIVAPYKLDARLCISYLTIEHKGSIDVALRPLMGNRIFGCDDCQLFCPWNKFATPTHEKDFAPRHGLENSKLIDLFMWSEAEFLKKTEGSAIRRATYIGWLRNIAIALGNAGYSAEIMTALQARENHTSELVREHVAWALQQQLIALQVEEHP